MKKLGVLLLTALLLVCIAAPAFAELETKTVTVLYEDMIEVVEPCNHKPIDITLKSSGIGIQSPDTICMNNMYTLYTNYIGKKSEVVFKAPSGWKIQKIAFGCQSASYVPSAKEGEVKVTSSVTDQSAALWTAPKEIGLSTVTFISGANGAFSFLSSIDRIHYLEITLVKDSGTPDTGDAMRFVLPGMAMLMAGAGAMLSLRRRRG